MGIYTDTVDGELARNRRLIRDSEVVRTLEKFANELKVSGLTDYRVMFYLIRLRVLARAMGPAFLKPARDDITKAIADMQKEREPEKPKKEGESEPDGPKNDKRRHENRPVKLSPRTIEDYKQAMRKFYSWHLSKKAYSQVMGHVKMQNNVNRTKKSEDMLTDSEMELILKNAMNPRDKALFSLLYDSGCRVGEILTLRIRDLKFDEYGALIHVTGKTGERNVRIVGNSIAYLREWIRAHPLGDPDSWLFVGINGDKLGQPLDYDTMRSALRKSCRRAGIKKRIHPHLFRHSAATRLAGVLSESVLKKTMGWSGGSRMAATYVHLNDTETDRAVLEAHGIAPEKHVLKSVRPLKCPRCGEPNPSNSTYCRNCWLPLTVEATLDLKEKEGHIQQTLEGKGLINPQIKAIIENMPENERAGILASIIELALKKNEQKS